MAIMEELPGLTVEVIVDGQPLREYHDPEPESRDHTNTCYIEATSGKQFSIRLTVFPKARFLGDCLSFHLYVDGKWTAGQLMCSEASESIECVEEIYGSEISPGLTRRFEFASLQIEDDEGLVGEATEIENLGSLAIDVYHKHIVSLNPVEGKFAPDAGGVGSVPKKVIKGQSVSHGVKFAEAVNTEPNTYCYVEEVWDIRSPFVTFVFKYRSSEALKPMLIIPHTPTPPPLEDREITRLSQDELLELSRQFRALKVKQKETATAKIKRERTDDTPRPRKIARPSLGDTLLELGEDEKRFREASTATLSPRGKVVIELD